mmetsp:Transcript_30911/g.73673  ORF Transcript_30911/g.73673 Transcript_30911/m.73673 type:complete len:353 (+) Transcript_30911:107-1165(+)
MTKATVTVTGVTGFIGSRVCLDFLQHGDFKVRGTVRDKSSKSKMDMLKKAFGEELFGRLDLVEADLLDEESLISACEGSTYIVHTASPVLFNSKDEDKLVKPAVSGTVAIMKAARKHGVKKVVITSSTAAIVAGHKDRTTAFTEEDWSKLEDDTGAYFKSKTLAEKAAWDFVKDLPEEEKFGLVTINPVIVLGPTLTGGYSETVDLGKQIVMGDIPMYPQTTIPVVDVRDVSNAHLQAVLRDDADGNRFILSAETVDMIKLSECLVQTYGKDYNIEPKAMSWLMCGFMALFNEEMREQFKNWKKVIAFDGSKATRMLGIQYIKHDRMMNDMVPSLIETGYIPDKRSSSKVAN